MTGPLAQLLMVLVSEVQSKIKSSQRLKMVLDTSLLNTQNYKVRIKCKWSIQRQE